ncbi:unnamed protein product, partial [Polarella glacialis]
ATLQAQHSVPEQEVEQAAVNHILSDETVAEREVHDVDVAEAISQSTDSLDAHAGKSRQNLWRFCPQSKRGKRLCVGMSTCGLIVLAAVVISVALLWPRKPQWKLKTLDFDKDGLTGLIASFTGNGGDNNSTVALNMTASVDLYNPNFVGVWAQPGRFMVLFNGKNLAVGLSEGITVPAHNSITIPASVNVELSPALAAEVGAEVMSNSFQMPVITQASTQVLLPWLGMKVQCEVFCTIQADVLQLLSDPIKIVRSKSCDYSYSF